MRIYFQNARTAARGNEWRAANRRPQRVMVGQVSLVICAARRWTQDKLPGGELCGRNVPMRADFMQIAQWQWQIFVQPRIDSSAAYTRAVLTLCLPCLKSR
jgi:hypothetical protein